MTATYYQTAESALLTPYDLTPGKLGTVFGEIFSHRVDYADLYFQYARSEAWSLEEGMVKSGSYSIDQGVGVRAVSGEKTAFAYSDEISLPALKAASAATRAIAAAGAAGRVPALAQRSVPALYVPHDPIPSLADAEKVKLLERLETYARELDPRVTEVIAHVAGTWEVVLVARSDGHLAADVRPLVRVSITVNMVENGKREQGYAGGGGRYDYGYFTDGRLREYAQAAVHQASVNLAAKPAPAGSMTVVLGAGWPGILLHEAIGHGLEGDFNRKGSSAFSGRVGQRVAARGVTVVDDGTIADRRGSLSIDDEGNPTRRTVLIEDGILQGYLQDTLNAIIRSVKKGLYAANFGGGQVDITSGKFVFSTAEAYLIEDGRITAPVKGATLIGNGPDVLTRVSMIGNDMRLDPGVGTCGKEGQSVPVGVGQPTLRVDGLTVGGTGH
ncbi:MAG: metalloprotease TldD [Rhodocyclales bacterium]|nr:metalloprotease TldD [Rhodocyclales bacterium]